MKLRVRREVQRFRLRITWLDIWYHLGWFDNLCYSTWPSWFPATIAAMVDVRRPTRVTCRSLQIEQRLDIAGASATLEIHNLNVIVYLVSYYYKRHNHFSTSLTIPLSERNASGDANWPQFKPWHVGRFLLSKICVEGEALQFIFVSFLIDL